MSRGDFDARISEMEARGYRVQSRGTHAAVLSRGPQTIRRLLSLLAAAACMAVVAFGLWRASWPFIVVGVAGAVLVVIDWRAARTSMTVRLTVDRGGNIREQLIQLGDET